MRKNITVVGLGYVGLANAIYLAKSNNVTGVDILDEKIKLLKNNKLPVRDNSLESELKNLKITFTTDLISAIKNADYVLVATPTDFDTKTKKFNTKSVSTVIDSVIKNSNAQIIIKSTIPIGYTCKQNKKHNTNRITFSPEFLREMHLYEDILNPSRIIVGGKNKQAKEICELFKRDLKNNPEILITNTNEAEAIKLFSNTYLAMRVAFFNEIDTYARVSNLDVKKIISGISLDKRIQNFYNNPSFGYGGYCFPKDTKQAKEVFRDIPESIISAVVSSNDIRKNFIANDILKSNAKTVGIYRLTMKKDSDNFRSAAIIDILDILKEKGANIIIYEPLINTNEFNGIKIVKDIDYFKRESDIIVANRIDDILADAINKVYTRSVFDRD
jgi:UDPglucose 6-dehydrogenase